MKRNAISIITVVKDDELAGRIGRLFPAKKARVAREPNIDRVLDRFESEDYDVLLITGAAFKAGEIDGIELLEVIAARSPATQILFIVEPRDIRIAMSALKSGTYQYAKLPISDEELRLLIEAAMEQRPTYDIGEPREGEEHKAGPQTLTGKSPLMTQVFRQMNQAARADVPILLVGETGSGKDLAAQAIHQLSDRKEGPYIAVNLGALPRELVASELFGHEKGAFTGAHTSRKGRFEEAHDGTIFLDEISTIDEKVQVSLLRLIEQKKFRRLGGRRSVSTNARLIAATNQDLADRVQHGAFREDLYYRLDVFRILLPPLRERTGDIPLLIERFLGRYNATYNKNISGITPECMSMLQSYNWPGNVRELKNVIQRAVLVCQGEVIRFEHLPSRFRLEHPVRPKVTFEVGTPLGEIEREMVTRTLALAKNNRKRAAELLGISRRALYNKLRKYRIE